MRIKKVKWLWSYQVDKIEKWLAEMAGEGWHLVSLNRWTRTFSFEKGDKKVGNFRIQYAPQGFELSETLKNAGWERVVSAGRWIILFNGESKVRLYPSRDSILKRNRMHAYAASGLIIFQLGTQVPLLLTPIVLLSMEDGFFSFSMSMWFLLIILAQAGV